MHIIDNPKINGLFDFSKNTNFTLNSISLYR